MPLVQDNSHGGGGPNNGPVRSCRTIAEFLGLDTMLTEHVPAPAVARNPPRSPQQAWGAPPSPLAAPSPRALVPPACFPPRHPRAFASYSESAQPGAGGDVPEQNGADHGVADHGGADHSVADLVCSLEALSLAAAGRAPSPPRLPCDSMMEMWSSDKFTIQLRAESDRGGAPVQRRASFCGAAPAGALRWTGALPARVADPPGGFSAKLFLGGLPWNITEGALQSELRPFQPVRVEWPGREAGERPRGFAYVTLESERRVRALLAACRRDRAAWYYRLRERRMRTKVVQVIPWAVADSNWVRSGAARLEAARTVFVGALHGMLSAAALAHIMDDLFSGVVYAGIDTDKNKYPIGSGRVTFDNVRSYVRAISAAYVEIRTDKFTKKVQVDPYLEDSMCSVCNLQQGPYFCREPTCFGYFCRSCWSWQHAAEQHKPLTRARRSLPERRSPPPALCSPQPSDGPAPPERSEEQATR